jgi:DNA-binding CsgD family transcriptional regulator
MLDVRGQMDETGFADRILKQLTAGKTGDDLIKARTKALEHIDSLAEDMAKNRILSYVDNPAVRSQLAMSARNFARFYRATEDFYRRINRAVKYNPESIVRASLTYEGISHSGFVQTDDNGAVVRVIGVQTDIYHLKTSNQPSGLSFIGLDGEKSYYNVKVDHFVTLQTPDSLIHLTKREKEILQFIVEGKTSAQIASLLFISKHTVDSHRKKILQKTNCTTSIELIAKVVNENLL